jgi:hypothetical protein
VRGGFDLVDVGPEHLDAVATLNDAEVPRVSPLGDDGLADHLPRCDLAVVAEVVAVLIWPKPEGKTLQNLKVL